MFVYYDNTYQAAASYITILMSRHSEVETLALSATYNTKYLFVDDSLEGKIIHIYR
ncbi:MAG: hypothetical protein IJ053_01380 [Lachnospiraceae bacterium]|nr:hypothetical protein [Lachnospiraceae bacterium]